MVNSAFQNSSIRLRKIVEATGLTDAPTVDTPMVKHNGSARDAVNNTVVQLPASVELRGTSNVNYAVEVNGFASIELQEWYLYITDDGFKWFKGSKVCKITCSTAYTVDSANAVGFYAQIVKTEGDGEVRVYASGDYVR